MESKIKGIPMKIKTTIVRTIKIFRKIFRILFIDSSVTRPPYLGGVMGIPGVYELFYPHTKAPFVEINYHKQV